MAWSNSALILVAFLAVLGYSLVHVTCAVLSHRLRTQIRRHDIIVHAHQKRQDYYAALTSRRSGSAD